MNLKARRWLFVIASVPLAYMVGFYVSRPSDELGFLGRYVVDERDNYFYTPPSDMYVISPTPPSLVGYSMMRMITVKGKPPEEFRRMLASHLGPSTGWRVIPSAPMSDDWGSYAAQQTSGSYPAVMVANVSGVNEMSIGYDRRISPLEARLLRIFRFWKDPVKPPKGLSLPPF